MTDPFDDIAGRLDEIAAALGGGTISDAEAAELAGEAAELIANASQTAQGVLDQLETDT